MPYLWDESVVWYLLGLIWLQMLHDTDTRCKKKIDGNPLNFKHHPSDVSAELARFTVSA